MHRHRLVPIECTAYKGHDSVVDYLGGRPLKKLILQQCSLASSDEGLNTVELLLRHGADHTVTTRKGTPL
jgi:hypothetical protein